MEGSACESHAVEAGRLLSHPRLMPPWLPIGPPVAKSVTMFLFRSGAWYTCRVGCTGSELRAFLLGREGCQL